MKLIPLVPVVVPAPLIARPRRWTMAVSGVAELASLIIIPWTPEERMLANVPVQSIVIDFVIVTAPKPPGSRQLISPGDAVLEMAPANVLQGAVREHGLASSPTPDTHVRVACAW